MSGRRPPRSIDPGFPRIQPTWWTPSFDPARRIDAPRLSICRWRQEERQRQHRGGGDEGDRAAAAERTHAPRGHGEHRRGVDLQRRRDAEQRARRLLARPQLRDERERGEQRRQRVVAVEEDGPEQHRGEHDGHEPERAQPEPLQRPRGAPGEADGAERHPQLEREHVVRVPDERRQDEHRHRPGRVLVVEVAIGDPPVLHERAAIAGVDAGVPRVGVAEEAAVGDGARDRGQRAGNRGRRIEPPPADRDRHRRIIPSGPGRNAARRPGRPRAAQLRCSCQSRGTPPAGPGTGCSGGCDCGGASSGPPSR